MDLQTSVAEFLKISGMGFAGALFLISLVRFSLPKRGLPAASVSPYVRRPISGSKPLIRNSASI
jgi:hypothetical protein